MDSHNDPGINIHRFIIAVVLISINIYGKSIKNDYQSEYLNRKVVETFFNMQYIPDGDQNITINQQRLLE
jgi:hypothetical protein